MPVPWASNSSLAASTPDGVERPRPTTRISAAPEREHRAATSDSDSGGASTMTIQPARLTSSSRRVRRWVEVAPSPTSDCGSSSSHTPGSELGTMAGDPDEGSSDEPVAA